MGNDLKINVSDDVKISESITLSSESVYLISSNKKKVAELLSKENLEQNDLIDIFIGLHIILEVGINTLFRQLVPPMIKKHIEREEIVDNLDRISFIDKTVMFIYYSTFRFSNLDKSTEYHGIIGKLRNFSEMRNRLLHGHAISVRIENGKNTQSKLMRKLNVPELQKQISDFRYILDGIRFYINCLDMRGITLSGKAAYVESYLDYSFLPQVKARE